MRSTNNRWVVGALLALVVAVVVFIANEMAREAPRSTEEAVRPAQEVVAPAAGIAQPTTRDLDRPLELPVVNEVVEPRVHVGSPVPLRRENKVHPTGRLVVRLLDAHTGEPVERANYSIVAINGHLTPGGVVKGGELMLELPTRKAVSLRFFAKGYAERDLELGAGPGAGRELVRVLRLNSRDVITINVVDVAGAPVAGAELVVDAWRDEPWVRTTDGHGVATLPLLEDHRLSRQGLPWAAAEGFVRKPGYLPARFEVVLATFLDGNGEPTTAPARGHPRWAEWGMREMHDAVVLLRQATITGQVVDAYGMPVVDARVRVEWQGQREGFWMPFTTDGEGRWFAPDPAGGSRQVQQPEIESPTHGGSTFTTHRTNSSIRLGPFIDPRSEGVPAGIPVRWTLALGDGSIYAEESVLEPGLNRRTWRLDPTVPESFGSFGIRQRPTELDLGEKGWRH